MADQQQNQPAVVVVQHKSSGCLGCLVVVVILVLLLPVLAFVFKVGVVLALLKSLGIG